MDTGVASDNTRTVRVLLVEDSLEDTELLLDELRKMNQSGMLALIYAHLFSLSQIREVFSRQVQQGKGPIPAPQPATAEA